MGNSILSSVLARRTLFALLLSSGARAQSDPVFQSKVNVVLVPVVVRDAAGRPIGNLTKDDFQLFDNGKRQTISSFSVVQRAGATSKVTIREPEAEPPRDDGLDAQARGNVGRPKRYVVYVFDDMNGTFLHITAVREAALRYFRRGLPSNDRVAIQTFSRRTTLDFTSDETKIESTLRKLRLRPVLGHGPTASCPDVTYFLADLIINRDDNRALEAVTQQTIVCAHVRPDMAKAMAVSAARKELLVGEQDIRVSLNAIKEATQLLARMSGERLIVLASPGFFAGTPDAIHDVGTVLDSAAKVNVTVSTLDARGVDTTGLMEASRGNEESSVERQYYRQSALADEAVLADLAQGAGGTFFHNNNDLVAGFAAVASPPEFSYVLGFSPAALKPNGSFHRLRIRLANHRSFNVQARRGYFALKPGTEQETAETEMHDAVFSRDEIKDMPARVQLQLSKSENGGARVTVVVKLDPTSLHLKQVDGRNRDSLTVVSAVFDQDGGYVQGARKTVNLALRDETLAHMEPGINVPSDFNVKPGTYMIRVVVREAAGKAMFSYNGWVTVR
jgi:VWFA-related protein